nr:MAG TPA: hypothetical protein [Caudoviricetes sp.]
MASHLLKRYLQFNHSVLQYSSKVIMVELSYRLGYHRVTPARYCCTGNAMTNCISFAFSFTKEVIKWLNQNGWI